MLPGSLVYPEGGEAVVFTLHISTLIANFTMAFSCSVPRRGGVSRYILSKPVDPGAGGGGLGLGPTMLHKFLSFSLVSSFADCTN